MSPDSAIVAAMIAFCLAMMTYMAIKCRRELHDLKDGDVVSAYNPLTKAYEQCVIKIIDGKKYCRYRSPLTWKEVTFNSFFNGDVILDNV